MPLIPAVTLFLAGFILLPHASGQVLPKGPSPGQPAAPAKPEVPEDRFGRTTPFGTIAGFLDTTIKGNYEDAVRYLDSRLPQDEKEQLARQLKHVIDRGLTIEANSISRDPQGELGDDGRRSNRLLVGTARVDNQSLDIYLDRVTRGTSPPVWLFSSRTLKAIPEFAESISPSWIETRLYPLLPKSFRDTVVFSLPLSQWLYLVVVLIVAALSTWLISEVAIRGAALVHRLATKQARPFRELGLHWPLRFIALLITVLFFSKSATTFIGRQMLNFIERLMIITAVVSVAIRCTEILSDLAIRRFQQDSQSGKRTLIMLARRSVNMLLILAGFLVALSIAGVNLSTVIAGLGIGGIALAFASQKTIENLFGTITFITDQPARVGDFCRIGEYTGTIESVGLRSSRIRTVDDTLLTVPNGQLVTLTLDNISARGKILFHHTIGLSYSTTSDQLKAVLGGIEELLRMHPRVESKSFRVRLIRFGTSSLDVELFAYILTRDWVEFLSLQQDLLIRVLQIVEASGTTRALPSLYLANTPGQADRPAQ